MKELQRIWRHDVWLRILTLVSIALLVWGFVLPPPGVIDGSVIAAVGELAGFAALWQLAKAIDKGVDAALRKGDTEITITSDQEAPARRAITPNVKSDGTLLHNDETVTKGHNDEK